MTLQDEITSGPLAATLAPHISSGADGEVARLLSVVYPLLTQMVADGLLTQPQVDAFTKRIGSRAEQAFGAGTVITWNDVAKAGGR